MNKNYWTTKGQSKFQKSTSGGTGGSKIISKDITKKLGKVSLVLILIVAVFGLFGFFFIVRPVYALNKNINELKQDSQNLKESLAKRDLVAFSAALDETEKDLKQFRKDRDSKVGWAKNLPRAGEYYADTEHFINAGLHGVEAGREFVVVVEPFSDALGLKTSESESVTEEDIGLAEAFSAWVVAMPVVAENSDGIIEKLTLVGEELSKVDASKYPESFRGTPVRPTIEQAQTALTQLNDYAPDIKKALTIAPVLLGVGGEEKRYMIMMQNDKEIRATGGFWTYFATFKINNALLSSDFTSYNSYNIDEELNAIDAYHTFPSVPAAYNQHLKVERMFARDANVSPDLPTSVDQFMYFWELAMPLAPDKFKPVDGVVVIDTRVLEELLEITGPATVNGVTYSSENVVLELEKLASLALAEQANRKKILGDLMEAMLINVFESEKNLWPKLVDKGADLLARKHIAVVLFDAEAQALVEEYNFGGRLIEPEQGDYAFVVQTNLGGDKTNWFVDKEVTHTLSQENGRWKRTVNVKYTYTEPGAEFAPFVKRFRDWTRLYVPQGAELINITGSEAETGEGEEMGKTYFHAFVTAGPGETKELTYEYYLPEGIVDGDTYNLYIQKQLGIDKEIHNVVVNGNSEPVELYYLDQEYSTKI